LFTNYIYVSILLFIILLINRKLISSFPFTILSLLLIVYFIIYLLSPYDLTWHLSTSLSRIFQHVYPAFIYLAGVSFKNFKINNTLLQQN
jgi:uncharacterized membrane protein